MADDVQARAAHFVALAGESWGVPVLVLPGLGEHGVCGRIEEPRADADASAASLDAELLLRDVEGEHE